MFEWICNNIVYKGTIKLVVATEVLKNGKYTSVLQDGTEKEVDLVKEPRYDSYIDIRTGKIYYKTTDLALKVGDYAIEKLRMTLLTKEDVLKQDENKLTRKMK